MSRIGKKPIDMPAGVKVSLVDGQVMVEGPKGKLSMRHHSAISVSLEDNGTRVHVKRSAEDRMSRSLHGLTRTLIANMIHGVTQGYQKTLELVGVGYQASVQAGKLHVSVGWAQPLVVEPPPGISFEVPDPTHVVIKGVDKQLVGQVTAEIRRRRPPEPYKGKGIRYQGEVVRRKAGKAFASGGA